LDVIKLSNGAVEDGRAIHQLAEEHVTIDIKIASKDDLKW
jgi:hypothetical protein